MKSFIEDGVFNTKAFGEHITRQRSEYLSLEHRVGEALMNNFASNAGITSEVLITDKMNDDGVLIKTMAIGLGCIDMDISFSIPISSPNLSNERVLEILDELAEGLKIFADKHEGRNLEINRVH